MLIYTVSRRKVDFAQLPGTSSCSTDRVHGRHSTGIDIQDGVDPYNYDGPLPDSFPSNPESVGMERDVSPPMEMDAEVQAMEAKQGTSSLSSTFLYLDLLLVHSCLCGWAFPRLSCTKKRKNLPSNQSARCCS